MDFVSVVGALIPVAGLIAFGWVRANYIAWRLRGTGRSATR